MRIKKYLKETDIFINDKNAYGVEIEEIIKSNQEIIKNYKHYLSKIKYYNEKVKNPYYAYDKIKEIEDNNIPIIKAFNELINNIYSIIFQNKNFVLFHLCRITKNEEQDIVNNGFMLPSKPELIKKIKKLNLCSEYECQLISYINNLKSLQAEQQIYFKLGNYQINRD